MNFINTNIRVDYTERNNFDIATRKYDFLTKII